MLPSGICCFRLGLDRVACAATVDRAAFRLQGGRWQFLRDRQLHDLGGILLVSRKVRRLKVNQRLLFRSAHQRSVGGLLRSEKQYSDQQKR